MRLTHLYLLRVPKIVGECTDAGIPVLGLSLQGVENYRLHLRRNLWIHSPWRGRISQESIIHDCEGIRS